MEIKEQEILKFDVIDNQKMLIPSDVKINNLKSEYDLTYDFKNRNIGEVKNIKKVDKSLVGDIEIKDAKIKLQIDDYVFRTAFKSNIRKNVDGIDVVRDLDLILVSVISKDKDVYD